MTMSLKLNREFDLDRVAESRYSSSFREEARQAEPFLKNNN